MNSIMNKSFRMTVVAASLLSAFGVAAADEVAELTTPDSSISIGVGSWSKDRPQQGIYDGMREAGAYGLVDVNVNKRDDATGTWFKLNGTNLGLENRELRFDILRQGDIGGYLEYNKTPRDNPYTFLTGLQGIGSTSMLISGSGANALPARNVQLGTTRERLGAGFYKSLLPGLDFRIDFKNEEKKGTRPYGLGSQALFMVEPINSTTRQLEAVLDFRSGALQLSGGYMGSWYGNDNTLLWGRVNGTAPAGGTTSSPNSVPLSQPLDSQAHQLFLDGGYNFTKTTRMTFKLAYTRATQDEYLPTWGLGVMTAANTPPNGRFVNAPSHLDGRIDTTLAQIGLTSRPFADLSLAANVRYHDVNDKTPIVGFVGNATANPALGVPTVFNTPHSYSTLSGKLEATYRLPMDFSLMGGIDYSTQDRSVPTLGTLYVPFRSRVDETTYRVQLRRALDDNLNGTIAYYRSERRGSGYNFLNEAFEDAINPLHIADRNRDKWRLMLDWTPLDKLSLQFMFEDARDKYPHDAARPYGMLDGSSRLYSVDASYTINDKWQLNSWLSYDTTKAREYSMRAPNGATTFAQLDANKLSDLKEVGAAFGAGLRGNISEKFRVSANYEWHKTTSKYGQSISTFGATPAYAAGTAGPLPDIRNKLSRLKLSGSYALEKNSELTLDLVHERWNTDDWTWNFANGTPFIYGTNTDGTSVTMKQKQTADFVGIRYVYKWQ